MACCTYSGDKERIIAYTSAPPTPRRHRASVFVTPPPLTLYRRTRVAGVAFINYNTLTFTRGVEEHRRILSSSFSVPYGAR